ncbi:hypothetical protein GGI12_003555 [Dipsacomyces acuminosporus]|nr:hypothetical protein GGI12_003555 [Dipsacomyces acuminosporus]
MVAKFQDIRPKFLRRKSDSRENDNTTSTPGIQRASAPPPLPPRHPDNRGSLYYQQQQQYQQQQYQQQQQPPKTNKRESKAFQGLQALSQYLDGQQQIHQTMQEPQAPAELSHRPAGHNDDSSSTKPANQRLVPPPRPPIDDKAPTTDRLAEFRLDIPNGVRNMTQHPGDTIVGSVVVTVTKPLKALRISLLFKGQERVYLLESAPHSPINLYTKTDYTFFEKRQSLWGKEIDSDYQQQQQSIPSKQWETLPPGTLTIPFSIQIPHVNYPSTVQRDKVCSVRYFVQAFLERPGKLTTRSTSTPEEFIVFEPTAYPAGLRDVLRVDNIVPGNLDCSTSHIGVHIQGGLSKLPALAGDRVLYKLDAVAVNSPANSHAESQNDVSAGEALNSNGLVKSLATSFVVRYMTIRIIECLELRGMIKGIERTQTRQSEVYTARLLPNGQKQEKYSNSAPVFSTTGFIRLPVELCPFDSKLLTRTYEMRIDCEIADKSSFLDKVTRSTASYSLVIPLNVCTVPPEKFTSAAYKNEYMDESLNISSIAPPPQHKAAAEPTIRVGGWELERSHAEWNKNNPTWIELANRKNDTPAY